MVPGEDPGGAAETVDLRYVNDNEPGIRRRRAGRGFAYSLPDGNLVRDRPTLRRIRGLGIPPAYTDVWICQDPQGHIQATGRDARGRKQYRYHPRWIESRDADKFARLAAFASVLPRIRQRVARDLALPGLPRDKVLACLVRLLDTSLIRIGNDEYSNENKSFGLTTLRDRHVSVAGEEIRFRFTGKSGKQWNLTLRDRRLAKLIKACQDVPGQRLFQYIDEAGERHSVGSNDVNEYLRAAAGDDFSAKDFRTWAGTVMTAGSLVATEPTASTAQRKRILAEVIRKVAGRLGNTPAVCRKCYVHPDLIAIYMDQGDLDRFGSAPEDERPGAPTDLSAIERNVKRFLEASPLSPPTAGEAGPTPL